MYNGKPIIGLLGGIGSGKSYIASIFAQLGCAVISADELVTRAYDDPSVRATLAQWWGPSVLRPDGSVDRNAIANRAFADPADRQRLESLIHPLVNAARQSEMLRLAAGPAVRAFVWDIPLLVESGQHLDCDFLVFVDAPPDLRQRRLAANRGWPDAELARREKWQAPLDKKLAMSQYTVVNAADAGYARNQVEDVLSRILASPHNASVRPSD